MVGHSDLLLVIRMVVRLVRRLGLVLGRCWVVQKGHHWVPHWAMH